MGVEAEGWLVASGQQTSGRPRWRVLSQHEVRRIVLWCGGCDAELPLPTEDPAFEHRLAGFFEDHATCRTTLTMPA